MSIPRRPLLIAAACTLPLLPPPVRADIALPRVFGHHMVLQRDQAIPVWGWAAPGEDVTVRMDDGPAVPAKADAAGAWRVALPALPAGGPHRLLVSGANTIAFEDVLVGEVWLCSGQSNMEWPVHNTAEAAGDIAAANFPQIRHLAIPKVTAGEPQRDVNASWTVCSPATAGGFTGVGYFFGLELHQRLNVPVGLINSSWGGTLIEPWTAPEAFALAPTLTGIQARVALADPRSPAHKAKLREAIGATEAWLGQAKRALEEPATLNPPPAFPSELAPLRQNSDPCALFHAMIHPLVPYGLRGAIWYQGESNHGEGRLYTDKMRALIEGWRGRWQQGPFPFYFVQIAPFQYGEEPPHVLPVFWEAQAAALAITNTGMAVIHDVGNTTDIHPRNKKDVGRRLARQALAKTYGQPGAVWSGPVFASLAPEGNLLRVRFEHAHGGLKTRDGQAPSHFEIVGPDTDYVPADARIEGDCVLLSSAACPAPAAVRFGWHKTASPNLVNGEGLPAAPFRAGRVPVVDLLGQVPEAKAYSLVYDLDLAKLGAAPAYDEDHSSATGRFDRVAYFLELKKTGSPAAYLFVSMDAFTAERRRLGIPTAAAAHRFQTVVSNLSVYSSVSGIATGANIGVGNLEFWPNNYGPQNAANVPGADAGIYDIGDGPVEPVDGYGSMQVHHTAAQQTLFAINRWTAGAGADLGIGNSPGQTRDWTFTGNAGSYTAKRLRILVRPAP